MLVHARVTRNAPHDNSDAIEQPASRPINAANSSIGGRLLHEIATGNAIRVGQCKGGGPRRPLVVVPTPAGTSPLALPFSSFALPSPPAHPSRKGQMRSFGSCDSARAPDG